MDLLTQSSTSDWKLIYRASSDGMSADKFHEQCDGHSPTVTLTRTTDGRIIGGYTAAQWTSAAGWVKDEDAFLFKRVAHSQGSRLEKITESGASAWVTTGFVQFQVSQPKKAIRQGPGTGPRFGSCDMILLMGVYGRCFSRLQRSYAIGCGSPHDLTGRDGYFDITEIEIFEIRNQE